jgi:hypothetical protein
MKKKLKVREVFKNRGTCSTFNVFEKKKTKKREIQFKRHTIRQEYIDILLISGKEYSKLKYFDHYFEY